MLGATATTTHELQLKPAVKKRLLTELHAYAALAQQRREIDEKMEGCRGKVEAIQIELEESSLSIEGFKSTIVAPMRRTFDKKKFVRLGGDLNLYDAAQVTKPGKSYVKITPPGEKADHDESED